MFLVVTGLVVVTILVSSPVGAVHQCKTSKLGHEYSGTLAKTVNGLTCQAWTSQDPQTHKELTDFPEGSEEGAKNYCRNPDDSPDGPWCYTTDPDVRWEYCDVKFCEECKKTKEGAEYSGIKDKTVNGLPCQAWASQSPQTHKEYTDFPEGNEADADNYCRNPDGSPDGPWCYTTDPTVRWEYCDVKLCGTCVPRFQ